MSSEKESGSWWKTLPGVLTGIAAIVTAITGLVVALNNFGGNNSGDGSNNNNDDTTESIASIDDANPDMMMDDAMMDEVPVDDNPDANGYSETATETGEINYTANGSSGNIIYPGDGIKIKDNGGRYFGYFDRGADYKYPIMEDNSRAATFSFENTEEDDLYSGSIIQIVSLESGLEDYNLLGQFGNDEFLYYWEDYGNKTLWTIEKADGSEGEIRYGDKVYFINEHYDQYLNPKAYEDDFYFAVSDVKYAWTLEKP